MMILMTFYIIIDYIMIMIIDYDSINYLQNKLFDAKY